MKPNLENLHHIEIDCAENITTDHNREEIITKYRNEVLKLMSIENFQGNDNFMTNAFFHNSLILKMKDDLVIRDILSANNLEENKGTCAIFNNYITPYRCLDSQEKFEKTIYNFLSEKTEQNQKLSLILDNLKTAQHKIFNCVRREISGTTILGVSSADFDLTETTTMSNAIFYAELFRSTGYENMLKNFKRETSDGDYIAIHLRYSDGGQSGLGGHSVVVMRDGDKCVFFDVNVCARFVIPEECFFEFLFLYSFRVAMRQDKKPCGMIFTNNTKRIMAIKEVEDPKPEAVQSQQDPTVAAPSPTVGTPTTNPTSKLPIEEPASAIGQAQSPTLVVHTDDQYLKPEVKLPDALGRAGKEEDDKQSQLPTPAAPSDDKNPQLCFPKLNWFYIGICSSVCPGLTMSILGAVVGDKLTWGVAVGAILGAVAFGAVLGGLIGKCVSDSEVSQLNPNGLGKK